MNRNDYIMRDQARGIVDEIMRDAAPSRLPIRRSWAAFALLLAAFQLVALSPA